MDSEKLKMQVGCNIAACRKKAGMTQAELAMKLNYTDKAVSKWERGESVPDLPTLVQLAELFDISLDSLENNGKELDLLKCFADNGITQVRLQHVGKNSNDNVREYANRFRRQAYFAQQAGEKAGVRCVIQLHGMCYPHNRLQVRTRLPP